MFEWDDLKTDVLRHDGSSLASQSRKSKIAFEKLPESNSGFYLVPKHALPVVLSEVDRQRDAIPERRGLPVDAEEPPLGAVQVGEVVLLVRGEEVEVVILPVAEVGERVVRVFSETGDDRFFVRV